MRAAFAELGLPEAGFTLCLMGCDDARIAGAERRFSRQGQADQCAELAIRGARRGLTGECPTCPNRAPRTIPRHLGDIAIAYDTCAAEAAAAGKPMADHVTHLVVHGLLHLLGYDHVHDADAELMEAAEVRILARLGLSDPY